MDRVEEILKKDGPMLSGALANRLERKYAISNTAARKAISRAKAPVQKLRAFPFNKNQVFCYLEEQYHSRRYKEMLYQSLKKESLNVAVILHALENSSNILKKDMLPIYSKSPVENTKGHRNFERIISDLVKQGILYEIEDEYYAISSEYSGEDYNLIYSRSEEQVARIAVNDFVSWAAKLNMIAYNSFKIFPDPAIFAHFKWFSTIPSYVTPLYDLKKKRPGFVVVDALIKSNITVEDVTFFVEKVKIIRNFKSIPYVAPVLLVNGVSNEALQYLKENKIVVGILSNLFDKRYTEILMNIYTVLQNATTVIMREPQKLEELMKEIAKNEGRFNNAMGDLFECMVGLLFNRSGSRYLELNKQIPNDRGGKYEMDVLVERDGRIMVIECKAYRGNVGKEYVEKWLSSRIPAFRKFLEGIYPGRKQEFSIWSLGGFDEEAAMLLEKHKTTAKKYKLSYLDKKAMCQYAKELNDKLFCEQIQKHFKEYGEEKIDSGA